MLDKYFGEMYIIHSISPVFPAPYDQSRRIDCDALKKLKDTGMIGIVKGKLTFNKDQYTKAIAELAVLRKGANHW